MAAFFSALEERGVTYGSAFRGLRSLYRIADGEVAGDLALPEEAGSSGGYILHPALIDAALQAVAAALPADDDARTLVPARLERGRILRPAGTGLTVRATARRVGANVVADLRLEDGSGLVAYVVGLEFQPVTAASMLASIDTIPADSFYTIEMEARPLVAGLLPPDFLPSPQAVCAGLAPLASEAGLRFGLPTYAAIAAPLDRITAAFIQRCLVELGLDWQPGTLITLASLAGELGIADRHRRLLRRMLAILAEDGMLAAVGPAWRIVSGELADDPAPELTALIQAHPVAAAELALVARAGPSLASVLTGRTDPLTILFPPKGGGAADLYGTSGYAQTVNALLRHLMERVRGTLPEGRVLRLLEVGAGTGGATAAVLEALPPGIGQYWFTDLSPMFLNAAAERFDRPDLRFARLDIEQDPSTQGIAPESVDVVLAANVLHATQDIRQSLSHILAMLAPGGVLVLVETTEARRWVDIVFGLTEGWWRFADRPVRTDHPLLSRARWLDVLAGAGFSADALPAGEIILARKPLAAAFAPVAFRMLGDDNRLEGLGLDDAAAQALYVAPPTAATFAGQVDLFTGLLSAIRTLDQVAVPSTLTILADGSLGHSSLEGFTRTLRLEQPALGLRLIQSPPSHRALLDELAAADGESQVTWRNGQRSVPRLRQAAAPSPAKAVSESWIVTGGSGDVGRAAACWLAEHGATRIVLTSRTLPRPLPDLEAQVERHAVDVADEPAMAAIIASIPDLQGIVHAAGLLDDAPVRGQTPERFAAVMRAKVEGALTLDRLIGGRTDVRLVFFSSVAGVLGSAEQANHSAASSFLDALASHRRSKGLPTVSVDWGIWREIGAAARLGVVDRAQKLGLGTIGPGEGVAAFAAALGEDAPVQLVVLPRVDWHRFLGQFAPGTQPVLLDGIVSAPAAAAPAHVDVSGGPLERLAQIVADVVGLKTPADPDTPLPDFGLDSLMAVEIRNRIQRELGVDVGVRELLEGIDIRAIMARVDSGTGNALPVRRIEPDLARRHDPFPLTDIQQAYWIGRGDTLELGNVGCYLYTEVDLRDVDLGRLEQAWNELVRRHDMLRAIILPDGCQQILANVPPYRFEQQTLTAIDEEGELLAIREHLSHLLPDPVNWPLFDIRVTHHQGGSRLHIGLDLLVLDAASIFQLREEWGRLYENAVTVLPPIGLSFRDFVLEGQAWRQSETWQRSARYWHDRLSTLPPGPDLPLARQPGQIGRPRFVRRMDRLPAPVWQRLQAEGQARGITPSALLAAIYGDILAAFSRNSRFCVTLTSFNRPPLHPDIGALIGDFTSTILLEFDATPATFAERAVALQRQLASDLDHAEVGGVQVLREIARARGAAAASIPVVFTSALGFRAPQGQTSSWDRISDMVHSVAQTPQVWIDHQVSEHEGGLLFTWDVVEGLFPPGLMGSMFLGYSGLLSGLGSGEGWAGAVGASVALPVRPSPVVGFAPAPLFAGFLAQAARDPLRPAVLDGEGATSYGRLASVSGLAAGRLRSLGAGPERVVAVDLAKGWRQAAAVLAVLRAGAAYLPLDPGLPAARRAELVADAQAIEPDWPSLLDGHGLLDETGHLGGPDPLAGLPAVDPSSLAYVIFTSGSTGRPKGVMVEHAAALNTVLEVNRRWQVGPDDRVLGLSALNFDLSVFDLFGLLGAGGALVLPDEASKRDPAAWAALIDRHRVTVWNTVPALAAMLAEHGLAEHGLAGDHALRLFLLSGDWVPLDLLPRLRRLAPRARLVALGGATEASIWSIAHEIEADLPGWASVPYGQALANQTMQVVNQRLSPCPDWVVGEIEIGGIGLARGYIGDPQRTAERFRTDPATGERRYRTGDLGRFRPGQLIEFLGREDFQVKVQGHRIELGEIEAHLLQHPAIQHAVAAALPAPGQPYQKTLHAFVVARQGAADVDLWQDGVDAAAKAIADTAAMIEPGLFDDAADRLTRFTAGAAADALGRLGAFAESHGTVPTVDDVIERCRIVPGYRRWLGRTLDLIRQYGRDAAEDDPLKDFAAFDRFGFGASDLELLRRLTRELPDILTGRKHAGDIYLDAGTPEVYAKLFRAPYAAIGRAIRDLAVLQPLSILEVGAGLGTTLAGLQDHLPLDRVTYCFTDVSQHFIHMAERRLGSQPWLEIERLDLMEPVEPSARIFDVVIASSVLHAVPDLAAALTSIRRRLRPGGLFVILEETRFQPWYDLSMGLQSGFDSFQTDDIRKIHPLLSRPAWKAVLQSAGFDRVEIPQVEHSIGDRLGLDVILAALPFEKHVDPSLPSAGDLVPELRAHLARHLPDYMVPRFIHRMDRLPLTSNGKVDRGGLGSLASRQVERVEPDQPASAVERELARLVGDVLGTLPPQPTQSFFDLGADSLKLVMIQRRLRGTGHSLDMSILFGNPTVRGISAAMTSAAASPSSPPLVLFEQADGRPFLFTVPGVVAIPYYLRTLAEVLSPHVTLAALQLPGFVGTERPMDRIESQAAFLVAAMRSLQPRGPYLLLGHSYGGTVVYEAARQLRFQGDDVAFLGMLDTVVTESSLDDFQNDRVAQGSIVRALYALYGDRLPVAYDAIRNLEPDLQIKQTMAALATGGMMDLELAVEGVVEVFKANFRAMAAYQPGGYDGAVTLFRTEGGFPKEYYDYESGGALDDPALGWSAFVRGPIQVEALPGDHLRMLDADHLPGLAARIAALIDTYVLRTAA